MQTVIIILAIIGLLKLVSLFILCVLELYFKIVKRDFIEIEKSYAIYHKEIVFYIIPTIGFYKSGKFFEIKVDFLGFEYYAAYSLHFTDDGV